MNTDQQSGRMWNPGDKWDRRFLELAAHIATWSKDPNTKTGAVIVRDDRSIVGLGFNGMPRKVQDLPDRYNDREKKLRLIVHCEMNAILSATHSCVGTTLYTYPFASCSKCAGMVIQSGIKRVVAPICTKEPEHWMHRDLVDTKALFVEAGVVMDVFDFELLLQINGKIRSWDRDNGHYSGLDRS